MEELVIMEKAAHAMTTDVQAIREDLTALKSDATTFARDIRDNSGALAREGAEHVRAKGAEGFDKMESHVRENPAQSLILAFCGGLVCSYLLGRR
jgi:ElaB/YqjD/DUF883 family membrane-anchored ribosome-binding protein